MDIEQQLKNALRSEDPGPQFTAAVLERVARGDAAAPVAHRRQWQLPMALAASVVVAVVGLSLLREYREAQRAAAAQQLAVALEITGAQLKEVQQRLNRTQQKENGI